MILIIVFKCIVRLVKIIQLRLVSYLVKFRIHTVIIELGIEILPVL